MTTSQVGQVVKRLQAIKGQDYRVARKILADMPNQDHTVEGMSEEEGLTDPGINHRGVTGTGEGRELGSSRDW